MRALQAKVETEAEAKNGTATVRKSRRSASLLRCEVVSSRMPGSIGAGKRVNRDNAPEGMHPKEHTRENGTELEKKLNERKEEV